MIAQYKATVAATFGWLALHLTLGLLTISSSHNLWLTGTAMALAAGSAALAARPLLAPYWTTAVPGERWLLLLSIPLVQLLDLAALEPSSVTGYANWASGCMCLAIAALVMRGETLLAVLGSLSLIVSGVLGLATWGTDDLALSSYFLLAVPAQTWLAASYGVRRLLTRAEQLTSTYERRAAEETSKAVHETTQSQLRATREQELEAAVMPFARRILQSPEPRLDEWATQAGQLSLVFRDTLRARDLIDARLAAAIAAARAQGTAVQLSGSTREGRLDHLTLDATRELLLQLLDRDGLRALSLHLSAEPRTLTMTLDLPPVHDQAVEGSVRNGFPDWHLTTARLDDQLLLSCVETRPETAPERRTRSALDSHRDASPSARS